MTAVKKLHLKFLGINDRTLRAYRRAVRNFFLYLKSLRLPMPKTDAQLDEAVSEYINHCYQEGEPVGYAGHLLSGFKRFLPRSKTALPTSRLYFSNWQRSTTPKRATPLSLLIVQAMAAAAARVHRWDLAACLLLGFVCFLRTAEILGLLIKDIKLFDSSNQFVIALRNTKTSRNAMESLAVTDKVLVKVLRRAIGDRAEEDPLFKGSAGDFRRSFAALILLCEVKEHDFTPYSLRRGGATWFFAQTQSFDATVYRGRWLCPRTARIYLDDARAALVHLRLNAKAKQVVHRLMKYWRRFV
jgi:integrase